MPTSSTKADQPPSASFEANPQLSAATPGATPASSLYVQLIELQTRRKFFINLVNQQTNAAKALVRRGMAWRYDLTEDERKKINTAAAKQVSAVLSGKAAGSPDMMVVAQAIAPLIAAREGVEKEMKKLVRTLPIHAWARNVRGLGELGLAVILAEAGDLAGYPSKGHLWKRFGFAPYGGKAYSTWRKTKSGGLSADEWTAAGYKATRLAQVFGVVTEPLLRAQTVAGGPYRSVYDRRRAATALSHPDWTKAHSHADGLRVMTKALLRDLWKANRRAVDPLSERTMDSVPASRRTDILLPARARADVSAGTFSEMID
jgi:hypothetical protein